MADERKPTPAKKSAPKKKPARRPSWSARHRRELAPLYIAFAVLVTGWVAPDVDGFARWLLIGAGAVAAAALLLTRSWVDRKRERVVVVLGVLAVGGWLLATTRWGITRPLLYTWAGMTAVGGVLWWTDWFQTGKTRKAKAEKAPRPDGETIGMGKWWTDAALRAAFTEAGLIAKPGADGEPAPGPKLMGRPDIDDYGATAKVRLPSGLRYSRVDAAREALAAAFDQPVHLVTVSQLRTDPAGVARIRVSLPYERTIRVHNVPEGSSWRDPLVVGRDRRGRDVAFPTYDVGQVLVGGRTGSGKTHFLRLLASHYAADPDADLYIVDGKGSTDDWGPIRSRCKRLLFIHDDNPAQRFTDLLEHVQSIVTDRNRRGGRDWPGTLVVLEEFSSMLASLDPLEKKDTERAVTRLVQTCRSANVMVVIAAQRPSASTMDTNTRAQAAVSVALAMKSNTDITMVLGHTPTMELPSEPGEAILVVPGREDVFIDLDTIPDGDWEDLCASWTPPPVPSEPRALPASTQMTLSETLIPGHIDDGAIETGIVDFDSISASTWSDDFAVRPIPVAVPDDVVNDADLYDDAVALVTTTRYATRQMLSRKLRIGWAAAGQMVERLEGDGVIGPEGEEGRHDVLWESAAEGPAADLDVRESPEGENGPETAAQEPEQPGPANAVEAVMRFADEQPGEFAASRVKLALDAWSHSSVKQALAKLVADGRLVRVRQGYYAKKETQS